MASPPSHYFHCLERNSLSILWKRSYQWFVAQSSPTFTEEERVHDKPKEPVINVAETRHSPMHPTQRNQLVPIDTTGVIAAPARKTTPRGRCLKAEQEIVFLMTKCHTLKIVSVYSSKTALSWTICMEYSSSKYEFFTVELCSEAFL